MKQTEHTSLTALFKAIKEEKLQQFAVLLEDKPTDVEGVTTKVYNLSRPWPTKLENKE